MDRWGEGLKGKDIGSVMTIQGERTNGEGEAKSVATWGVWGGVVRDEG